MDWPSTLKVVANANAKEVVHVGSALVSSWFDGWGEDAVQTEAKITEAGVISMAPPPKKKRR